MSALLLALSAALSAVAIGDDNERIIKVSAAGLDLAQPADAKRFTRRVDIAVRLVCSEPGARSLAERQARLACMSEAVARSRPTVDRMIAAAAARRETQVATR